MKKASILILLVVAVVGTWFYVTQYNKYGEPYEVRVVNSGHFFEGSTIEKEFLYAKDGNYYSALVSYFDNEEISKQSFFKKLEHYRLSNPNNKEIEVDNDTYIFRGNPGSGPFLIVIHDKERNIEMLNENNADEFYRWFLKYR